MRFKRSSTVLIITLLGCSLVLASCDAITAQKISPTDSGSSRGGGMPGMGGGRGMDGGTPGMDGGMRRNGSQGTDDGTSSKP
jgi:predicted small secreted protein